MLILIRDPQVVEKRNLPEPRKGGFVITHQETQGKIHNQTSRGTGKWSEIRAVFAHSLTCALSLSFPLSQSLLHPSFSNASSCLLGVTLERVMKIPPLAPALATRELFKWLHVYLVLLSEYYLGVQIIMYKKWFFWKRAKVDCIG